MKQHTALIKQLNIPKESIIAKGMFSIIHEYTSNSVIKTTLDPTYSHLMYLPTEETIHEPYFISGNYHDCEEVVIEGKSYSVEQYVLPKLKPLIVANLTKEQKVFHKHWRNFLNEISHIKPHENRFYPNCREAVDCHFKDMSYNFRLNLHNLINGMTGSMKFDAYAKRNLMLDDDNQIVITDPIFCYKTSNNLY